MHVRSGRHVPELIGASVRELLKSAAPALGTPSREQYIYRYRCRHRYRYQMWIFEELTRLFKWRAVPHVSHGQTIAVLRLAWRAFHASPSLPLMIRHRQQQGATLKPSQEWKCINHARNPQPFFCTETLEDRISYGDCLVIALDCCRRRCLSVTGSQREGHIANSLIRG